jgi:hypothetical protein
MQVTDTYVLWSQNAWCFQAHIHIYSDPSLSRRRPVLAVRTWAAVADKRAHASEGSAAIWKLARIAQQRRWNMAADRRGESTLSGSHPRCTPLTDRASERASEAASASYIYKIHFVFLVLVNTDYISLSPHKS